MLFGRRNTVSLYVAVALLGAAGVPGFARAQLLPPSAPLPATEVERAELPGVEAAEPVALAVPSVEAVDESRPAVDTIDIARALARLADSEAHDRRDREGLVAAYAARDGRPIWMTPKGATPAAMRLADEIGKAGDWGLSASEFDVPTLRPARADGPDLTPDAVADAELRLSLATLRYARHARGGRFEPTDLTPFLDRKAPVGDPATVLAGIASAAEPDAALRQLHPQHAQFEQLRARYLLVREAPRSGTKGPTEAERLLANMEQWRWMPADLGRVHIWVNIPQQTFNLVRDGAVIHTERIIIGRTNAQTPVFSDQMRFLVFHPFWGVPSSIKINEILPAFQRGSPVLQRRNLRLQLDGKDVDPSRFDWRRTDIRRFHVYQAPGGGNALGVVKFMFPNKHDVYLHDTPSKSLFRQSSRAVSAGCVRVQDPLRFAELLLANDQGLSAERVRALAARDAPENNQVNLRTPVPVHLTYFTMHPGPGGRIESFNDVYGHEQRIRLALAGQMHLVQPVPQPAVPTTPVGPLVHVNGPKPGRTPAASWGYPSGSGGSGARPAWARQVFSGETAFSGN